MAKDEKTVIPALGQPFQLGMLYDQRRDQIISGVTLWDPDELKTKINSTPKPYTNYELITEDSLNTKTHVLGIEAELKLSVLSGLVSVSGAAKYVDDKKTSNSQARITGKYTTTTQYDELTMSQLAEQNIKYTDILNHPEINATHVVVGILYGADAFFIFDRTMSSDENRNDVQGKLNILVKKIPALKIDGNGQLNLDENQKQSSNNLTCKFYGDFRFNNIPTTFEDAVKLYCELPTLINRTGAIEGVPKKVWLHPLNAFAQYKIAKIVRNISASLIDLSINRMEHINELTVKTNDLIDQHSTLFEYFTSLKKQLKEFRSRLSEFDRQLKEEMRILLPKLRGGEREALEFSNLFRKIDSSCFNEHKLESWLASKNEELAVLVSFVSVLKEESISVVSAPLSAIISDIKYDFVCRLCLHFTELNDPQLLQMSDYLHNHQSQIDTSTTSTLANVKAWFYSPDIINKIRNELVQFIGFTKANKNHSKLHFIVNEGHADDYNNVKGASITLYKHGSLQASFQIPSQPGTPNPTEITFNSITLKWTKPTSGDNDIIKYKISYCIYRNKQPNEENTVWNEVMTDAAVELITISNLIKKTFYIFKVQAVTSVGLSIPSDVSFPIETPQPQTETATATNGSTSILEIKRKTRLNEPPSIHELKYREEIINQTSNLRKCYVGQPTLVNGSLPQEKIIMVVGATGAGKSTMINAFVNYFYGTQWKDDFRLKLITEEDEGINGVAKSQTKGQTKFITAYTFYHREGCAVPYTLTIIDTPGFGDVEGIKRDEEITKQIREFFMIKGPNGIDHLDAVGFVVQSSLGRLTPTQKYIFDSILSIFGKDIASNVFSLITFADGQPPPVLEAIKEAAVPSITHFKFNNSALFANNTLNNEDADTNVEEMFWKLGRSSLKKFFNEFQKAEPVSLTLTAQVLDERQQLEAFVQGIQQQIQFGLGKLEELKQEIQILKQVGNDIEKNKSFTYIIKVTKQRQISLPKGQFVTNCFRCNYTCHYPCTIANDEEKYLCAAMNNKTKNATCAVCPDKCSWKSHTNCCYRFELYQEDENRTLEDMKQRYEKAKMEEKTAQDMYEAAEKEYKATQNKVYDMIDRARQALERLDQIALKPNPLTIVDYIDIMIESETQEAKPGWMQRIEHLREARTKAETMQPGNKQTTQNQFAQSKN
jgi:ABC-type multidrug transport system fused ATPase/permease subunit